MARATVSGQQIAKVAPSYKTSNSSPSKEGTLEKIYVKLAYQPRRKSDGTLVGVLVVANDVTQQVRSRKIVEGSETKLRAIIETAPAGIGLFVGRDLIIENPNHTFIDIVGKGPGIVGLPLRGSHARTAH